jgi:hypothetical protein
MAPVVGLIVMQPHQESTSQMRLLFTVLLANRLADA